jgi:hypothetical protein
MSRLRVGVCVLVGVLAAAAAAQTNDRAHLLARRAHTVHRNVCQNIDSAATCHHTFAEGCSGPRGTYDAYLSFVKNTTPSPRLASNGVKGTFTTLDDFQSLDNQSADFGGHDEGDNAVALADLGEGNFFAVVGYLYYAKPGGTEACNCKLRNAQDKDFHIGIGFDAQRAARIQSGEEQAEGGKGSTKNTPAEQTSIVVEMTPHYRARFHPGWDLPTVQNQIGNQVKIVGQLLFDSEHGVAAQDCALAKTSAEKLSCWRGSAWEIHPVTEFFVCSKGTCDPNGDGWVRLEDVE